MHCKSFWSFQEIMRIQNVLKISFSIPLECQYLAKLDILDILKATQTSGYYITHFTLHQYGFTGNLLTLLTGFLSNRKQRH